MYSSKPEKKLVNPSNSKFSKVAGFFPVNLAGRYDLIIRTTKFTHLVENEILYYCKIILSDGLSA
jgi:hypothetical protein